MSNAFCSFTGRRKRYTGEHQGHDLAHQSARDSPYQHDWDESSRRDGASQRSNHGAPVGCEKQHQSRGVDGPDVVLAGKIEEECRRHDSRNSGKRLHSMQISFPIVPLFDDDGRHLSPHHRLRTYPRQELTNGTVDADQSEGAKLGERPCWARVPLKMPLRRLREGTVHLAGSSALRERNGKSD